MNRLFETINRPEPTLAVPFSEPLDDENIAEVAKIADVAEFRADLFGNKQVNFLIQQARRLDGMPKLLTIRNSQEGGKWQGTEKERIELMHYLLPGFDGVDIEVMSGSMEQVVFLGHELGKIVIASFHDFDNMPESRVMEDKLSLAQDAGADFVKFALMTNHKDDYERLKDFTASHASERVITVGMGEFGPKSRIELPGLGSRMTFAHNGMSAVAPGQLSYQETHAQLVARYSDYADLFSS